MFFISACFGTLPCALCPSAYPVLTGAGQEADNANQAYTVFRRQGRACWRERSHNFLGSNLAGLRPDGNGRRQQVLGCPVSRWREKPPAHNRQRALVGQGPQGSARTAWRGREGP